MRLQEKSLTILYLSKMELNEKDWQKLLDQYLMYGTVETELWENTNELQAHIINELRKAFARIKNKYDSNNPSVSL
jgi:hypothetical protein